MVTHTVQAMRGVHCNEHIGGHDSTEKCWGYRRSPENRSCYTQLFLLYSTGFPAGFEDVCH